MLYKFKSKATGDLIMLEPQGKQVLQIIGKEPGAQGIILPTEMRAAIDALQMAAQLEEAQIKEAQAHADAPKVTGPRTILLKQRIVPFVDMLQRAYKEDKDVVWGV